MIEHITTFRKNTRKYIKGVLAKGIPFPQL
jgi:hypothetical protein